DLSRRSATAVSMVAVIALTPRRSPHSYVDDLKLPELRWQRPRPGGEEDWGRVRRSRRPAGQEHRAAGPGLPGCGNQLRGLALRHPVVVHRCPALRNSSFIYRGRTVDVKQIGRELGVRYLLEGSVRKAGLPE